MTVPLSKKGQIRIPEYYYPKNDENQVFNYISNCFHNGYPPFIPFCLPYFNKNYVLYDNFKYHSFNPIDSIHALDTISYTNRNPINVYNKNQKCDIKVKNEKTKKGKISNMYPNVTNITNKDAKRKFGDNTEFCDLSGVSNWSDEHHSKDIQFREDQDTIYNWKEIKKGKEHKYKKVSKSNEEMCDCNEENNKKFNVDGSDKSDNSWKEKKKATSSSTQLVPYMKKKVSCSLGFNKPFGKSCVSCANCGGVGHIYKNCNYPITSFGIICYRLRTDNETHCVYPEYLMVQRKDSLNFVEFIRGKYSLKKRTYILKMFANMTEEERMEIKNNDFSYIWMKLWKVDNCHHFETEYKESKAKFDQIKKGYYLETDSSDGGRIRFDLDYILKNTISTIYESEWGFPKGKRNINESDMNCAIREFIEETSMRIKYLKIQNRKPMEEIFTGTNQVRYKHVYYIGTCTSTDDANIFHSNIQKKVDIDEIKHVRWLRFPESLNVIREQNVERRELFKRVNELVLKNICLV